MDYLHGADTRECRLTEEFTLSGKMADEELKKKRKIREGHIRYDDFGKGKSLTR